MAHASETALNTAAPFGPGERDMWYFVLFEATVFIAYFTAYMVYRMGAPELFLASQAKLSQNFGLANTLVLLSSSLTMALSVAAARRGDPAGSRRGIVVTMALAVIFLGMKAAEWGSKISAGLVFSTNVFFSFYYFLTAIHIFHVFIGLIVLSFAHKNAGAPGGAGLEHVQTGATFWHMVDFLWVFIFALLYVMR